MALQSNADQFDAEDPIAAKVLEGIRRGDNSEYRPGQPKGVPRVTAEEQAAQRAAVEERQEAASAQFEAERASIVEQLATGDIQGTDSFEARFTEAIESAVAVAAETVRLAPPNPWTATAADRIRHEERVRADERSKLEAAAQPADTEAELTDYFDSLSADADALADDDVADHTDDDDTDNDLYDPVDPWADGVEPAE
jgi:hypothetical protein